MTSPDAGFNLLDEPWIVVLTPGGVEKEVSILELFEHAPELMTIGGEVATQSFAITRLLLAFLHRTIDGPEDTDDWGRLWEAPELPLDPIRRYADRFRHRFNLFDAQAPFFQVPGLHTASNEVSGLEKLVADVPNGAPLFTTRSTASLRTISAAEAARWLVHVHAFDPSGIKSGAVGDPTVKGGRGYPIGTGWSGQLGGVLPISANLRETLLLNLVARDLGEYIDIGGPTDLPAWERPVNGPQWEERIPQGALDLYTWQTRRVRLVGNPAGVSGVVLSNGDKIAPHNRHRMEPHSVWRHSEPQSKKHKTTVYMPRTHNPERAFWRGLGGLLPAESGRRGRSNEPQRFLAPGILQWLGELSATGSIPKHYRARTCSFGMEYGPQSATVTEIIDDALSVDVALLNADSPALGQTAIDAVRDAEAAVSALWQLAENIAKSAGAEPKSGAGDRAQEQAYAAFDAPFRRWLGTLAADTYRNVARASWQRSALQLIAPVAQELRSSAGPAAWRGREANGRQVNVALADTWFRAALRKALPLAFEDGPQPTHQER